MYGRTSSGGGLTSASIRPPTGKIQKGKKEKIRFILFTEKKKITNHLKLRKGRAFLWTHRLEIIESVVRQEEEERFSYVNELGRAEWRVTWAHVERLLMNVWLQEVFLLRHDAPSMMQGNHFSLIFNQTRWSCLGPGRPVRLSRSSTYGNRGREENEGERTNRAPQFDPWGWLNRDRRCDRWWQIKTSNDRTPPSFLPSIRRCLYKNKQESRPIPYGWAVRHAQLTSWSRPCVHNVYVKDAHNFYSLPPRPVYGNSIKVNY